MSSPTSPKRADSESGPTKRGGTEAAIRHHYDLSNAFYALWLDETMTYSCALWAATEGDDPDDLAARPAAQADFHLAGRRCAARRPPARHPDAAGALCWPAR